MEEIWKILVVDDDQVDRMAVYRALKAAGMKLILSEAGDYAMAIAALKESTFDCIFLDYRLPDKDGLVLVQDLRQNGVKIPLVVLTGQGDEQIAVELMKAGATDYLPKSKVSSEALSRILRNAIRIHRAELEIEQATQQREQLVRQREDFVYRLTHDLRTPLVAADRMLTLLTQGAFGPTSSEMEKAIATMIRSNQNLLQMVNTILEVYRHDAGQKTLSFSPCNLSTLIQEVVQELMPLASEKGIALNAGSTVPALPLNTHHAKTGEEGANNGEMGVTTVMGDRLELRRVLTNLVGNAIKFTDQGTVDVRLIGTLIESSNLTQQTTEQLAERSVAAVVAEQPPHKTAAEKTIAEKTIAEKASAQTNAWVCVEVEDTGVGLSAEDQKVLFERFRQGKNKRSGSGLGLYLSHRIIEAHHGAISVSSEVGKGTLFRIRLPVQKNCDR
jgi:signal transduction histidine kinase